MDPSAILVQEFCKSAICRLCAWQRFSQLVTVERLTVLTWKVSSVDLQCWSCGRLDFFFSSCLYCIPLFCIVCRSVESIPSVVAWVATPKCSSIMAAGWPSGWSGMSLSWWKSSLFIDLRKVRDSLCLSHWKSPVLLFFFLFLFFF